ncbi:MAG TPA: diguanylate cyclase [Burkholderiales bacterium]|nr:diguanylate cyclase [Burkholderiales bacterium]
MNDRSLAVLLVSDDAVAARLVRQVLAEHPWRLEWVRRITDAEDHLRRQAVDVVLLDLSLPDRQGIASFAALSSAAPRVPVVILADRHNEPAARQAARCGAQDYLLKTDLDDYWLPRFLRSAIERKAGDAARFLEEQRAQVTLNAIGDAVLCTDLEGNVTFLNPVAEGMTGWSSPDAIGRPLAEVFRILDAGTREPSADPMARAIREERTVCLTPDYILVRRDGFECAIEDSAAPIRDRGGNVTGAVIVFRDVGAARAMAQKMAHLAQHDFLTELPNRMLLADRVENALSLARRNGERRAVLYLDLDGFKSINDALGHAIGDKLLQSVAQRLVACVREADTVSRQGGDEFVVLLSASAQAEDAALTAEKILGALAAPHHIAGKQLHVTASIGISIFPQNGRDAQALLRHADAAMYHAKKQGRSSYRFYTRGMRLRARDQGNPPRTPVQQRASGAGDRRRIDLEARAIAGVEALVR